MTNLKSEFHLDLPLHEAAVSCAQAIERLGWQVEQAEAHRFVVAAGLGPGRGRSVFEIEVGERSEAESVVGIRGDSGDADWNQLTDQADRLREAIKEAAATEEARDSVEEPHRGRFLTALAVTLLAVGIAAGGGYALGQSSGEDVDAARSDGREAGREKGAAIGRKQGLRQGLRVGRERGFDRGYQDSYRQAYRQALEAGGFTPTSSEPEDIPEPDQ